MALTWTATGDDGTDGTASSYEVRYSTAPIDDDELGDGRAGPERRRPRPPRAAPRAWRCAGLDADTTYYFAIKAFDEWGNAGPAVQPGDGHDAARAHR